MRDSGDAECSLSLHGQFLPQPDGQASKGTAIVLGKLSVRYSVSVCDQEERDGPSLFPFATQRLSCPFEDPAAFKGTEAQKRDRFRQVRDAIEDRVQIWLTEHGRVETTC